jgi:hypothetical protein
MGHRGGTYQKFYMPDLIKRNFQVIYFGTPLQDDLIRSVTRMGLSRDRRAPHTLTNEQKDEVYNHPTLEKLQEKREKYKNKLYSQGYHTLTEGKGTPAYDRYQEYNRKISVTANGLRSRRLRRAKRKYHDTIDEVEVDQQLKGMAVPAILTRPAA